jgi:hypothetical protein
VKILRVSILALALLAAFSLRAAAADNWLLGSWSAASGITYTFTAENVFISAPGGNGGPFPVTRYIVNGDTITVSADGLPGTATAKRIDDTHATLDTGNGYEPVTRQST